MGKFVCDVPSIQYTNSGSATIYGGDVVILQKTACVAAGNIPAGLTGTLYTSGVFDLPIASATTASAGALAYWDATNAQVTSTASTNLQIGYFLAASVSGETVCRICLQNTGVQATT